MHAMEAIICDVESAKKLADEWINANLIVLEQGFGMILVEKNLYNDIVELVNQKEEVDYSKYFCYYNSSIHELLLQTSMNCKIAYVETEYFGGWGEQAAIFFDKGKIVGPGNSINDILKLLGVEQIDNKDEFGSLELYKYRVMERPLPQNFHR